MKTSFTFTSALLLLAAPVLSAYLVGCGPGAMQFRNPRTGKVVRCDGGGAFLAWEREQNRNNCVAAAIAAGYEIEQE